MDKIYVISTCWCGIPEPTMEHFFTPHKALKRISEIAIANGFTKPNPTDDPEQYLYDYDDYLIENNICPDMDVSLHIIDLKKEVIHG